MSLSDKIKNSKQGTSLFDDIPVERMYALKIRAAIANAIYGERKRRGMSQAEFAQFCDVAQPMISKWESGEYNFSVMAWAALSHKLGIPFYPIDSSHSFSATERIDDRSSSSSDSNSYIGLNIVDFGKYYQKYTELKEN